MKQLSALALILTLTAGIALPAAAQQATPGTGLNYETRLTTLEDSIRAMNGQVEQLGYAIRRLDQSTQRMQADYDARLSKLEAGQQQVAQAAVAIPRPLPAQPAIAQPSVSVNTAEAVAEPEVPVAPVNGTLGALKMQNGRVTGGTVNPQSPPLPDTPADYGLTPQEQYDRAFALLRQADYENAGDGFKSFIDKYPKDKLTENAEYWYAETLYVRGKFDEAAVAFGTAYQHNPKGQKAADNLLKLGKSLANSGKIQDACTALAQLKNYPNASANVRANTAEERTKLKCTS